jgi:hypothetical protein
MKTLATILIAGTALISAPAIPAFAWDSHDNGGSGAEVINGQVNLGPIWSQMNVDVAHVGGSVSANVIAVGNTVEILTMTDSKVTNTQVNKGSVGAKLNATVNHVENDVWLSATAVCNAADVSTDPNVTDVHSIQICKSPDPSAQVNAQVYNTGGDVGVGATAIANQLSVDSNAASFPVDNWQENTSGMAAIVNAGIGNIAGDVSASATAVGNSAQIVQYDTGGH